MASCFLVRQARGPDWDPARGRREQIGWDQHVAFVDALSADGKIALGGPIGDVDGEYVVLVVYAMGEAEARALFADNPWMDSILKLESVDAWTLWVGADTLAAPT